MDKSIFQRASRLKQVLLVTAALALSGCSIAGGPKLDMASIPNAPDAWAARPDLPVSPIGDGWVNSFGDTDLQSLVAEALTNNRNLQSVGARLQAARASMRIARADLFPTVGLSATGTRTENIPNVYNATVSASWEADIWGRNLSLAKAGVADARRATADFTGARLALAGAVTRAYYDLSAAKQSEALARKDLATRKDTQRITDARSRAGLASMLDVRLARVAVANSEDRVQASLRSATNASRALEVLVGRYPSAQAQSTADLLAPRALPNISSPVSVLAGRPDLIAAEAGLEAAGLRAVNARHAMLPSLSINFSATSRSGSFANLFDPKTYVNAIAGSLLQPLFQGGALIAEANRQGELARAALFTYAETTLKAYQEVENSLDAEATLARQVEASATAAEEARTAVRLTRSRYVNGRSTIFDLLNAQTTAIGAETRAVEAKRARIENRVILHLALGDAPLPKASQEQQASVAQEPDKKAL